VKVGVVGWFTVTVIVAVVAHNPAVGVKVYVVVAVLLIAGDSYNDGYGEPTNNTYFHSGSSNM